MSYLCSRPAYLAVCSTSSNGTSNWAIISKTELNCNKSILPFMLPFSVRAIASHWKPEYQPGSLANLSHYVVDRSWTPPDHTRFLPLYMQASWPLSVPGQLLSISLQKARSLQKTIISHSRLITLYYFSTTLKKSPNPLAKSPNYVLPHLHLAFLLHTWDFKQTHCLHSFGLEQFPLLEQAFTRPDRIP